MKKGKKIVALLLCAVLLVGATIAGTLAYLTDKDSVENTFTVGKVGLSMDEAKVTEYGVVDGDTRVKSNTYKLIPGHEYVKDPTIYVDDNSEKCYVFVKVENGIAAIEGGTTIAAQMAANGWTELESGVYYKVVDASDKKQELPVFATFTIKTDADLSTYEGDKVAVTAYAIQYDGFGSATAAWAAVQDAYAG